MKRRRLSLAAALHLAAAAAFASAQDASSLALDLDPDSGLFPVRLGSAQSGQILRLLPVLDTTADAVLNVPVADICERSPASARNWNVFRRPAPGDVLVVQPKTPGGAVGESESWQMKLVSWVPEEGRDDEGEESDEVGLVLRRGLGAQARNVSVIERAMKNDGEYPWDLATTWNTANLSDGSDYSLMMYSNNPPRSSTSGFFTIRKARNDTERDAVSPGADVVADPPTTEQLEERKKCLDFLKSNGGVYNHSLDGSFKNGDSFKQAYTSANASWEVKNTGTGSTALSLQSVDKQASANNATATFTNVWLNMISKATMGRGTASLQGIQAARSAPVAEMNVVALNLGIAGYPGSAVLGGFDSNLVYPDDAAVFRRDPSVPGYLQVGLSEVRVGERAVFSGSGMDVQLSYEVHGIRLPKTAIDKILPQIGNPKFDDSVGGYVYSSPPNLKQTLSFVITNGSRPITVSVPASSLLTTETTSDNPLTSRNETGRTYLRLSPTADGSGKDAYLGRAFLQHVYMIESPAAIAKFHLNALPQKRLTLKYIIAASPSALSIFSGVYNYSQSRSGSPRIAPMVGGILGGLVVISVVAIAACIFLRRRRRRAQSEAGYHFADRAIDDSEYAYHAFEKAKEAGIPVPSRQASYDRHHYGHRRQRSDQRQSLSKQDSIRTTQTIPIHYSPTPFEKELGARFSSILPPPRGRDDPNGVSPPPPALGITTPSPVSPLSEEYDRQRRHSRRSEVSTIAREYQSSEGGRPPSSSVLADPPPLLQRAATATATIGRVISPENICRVEQLSPPTTPGWGRHSRTRSESPPQTSSARILSGMAIGGVGLARTASVGRRVTTPSPVDFERGLKVTPSSSRQGSSLGGVSEEMEGTAVTALSPPPPPPPRPDSKENPLDGFVFNDDDNDDDDGDDDNDDDDSRLARRKTGSSAGGALGEYFRTHRTEDGDRDGGDEEVERSRASTPTLPQQPPGSSGSGLTSGSETATTVFGLEAAKEEEEKEEEDERKKSEEVFGLGAVQREGKAYLVVGEVGVRGVEKEGWLDDGSSTGGSAK